jgi:hypothetical protein
MLTTGDDNTTGDDKRRRASNGWKLVSGLLSMPAYSAG